MLSYKEQRHNPCDNLHDKSSYIWLKSSKCYKKYQQFDFISTAGSTGVERAKKSLFYFHLESQHGLEYVQHYSL